MHPFKLYRETEGLTQKQLAKKLGTATSYIGQVETGCRHPSRQRAKRWEKKCSGAVSAADLLTYERKT